MSVIAWNKIWFNKVVLPLIFSYYRYQLFRLTNVLESFFSKVLHLVTGTCGFLDAYRKKVLNLLFLLTNIFLNFKLIILRKQFAALPEISN